jgi:hypothetical protein
MKSALINTTRALCPNCGGAQIHRSRFFLHSIPTFSNPSLILVSCAPRIAPPSHPHFAYAKLMHSVSGGVCSRRSLSLA